jgi:hypothetical protein
LLSADPSAIDGEGQKRDRDTSYQDLDVDSFPRHLDVVQLTRHLDGGGGALDPANIRTLLDRLRVVESAQLPVGTAPDFLQEHRPADAIVQLRRDASLFFRQRVSQEDAPPPQRYPGFGRGCAKPAVDRRLEEQAEDRPGQLGRDDRVGEHETRNASLGDRKLHRAHVPVRGPYVAQDALDFGSDVDVLHRLRELDRNSDGAPNGHGRRSS